MKRRVGWFALLALTASAMAPAAPQMPMVDGDADGVSDERDECPYTEPNIRVNRQGCPLLANDGDADGVADARDGCPYTPPGAKVDAKGCAIDSDFDGIADGLDACPNSALSERVGDNGCRPGEREMVAITRQPSALAPMPEVVKPGDAGAGKTRTGKGKRSGGSPKTAPTPAPAAEIIASAPTAPPAERTTAPMSAASPAPTPAPMAKSREETLAMEASRKEAAAARRAGVPVGGATDDSVRPPSAADRVKAETPSAAYLAAKGLAAPASTDAAPVRKLKPAKPATEPSKGPAGTTVPSASTPETITPSPAPETMKPSPAPGEATNPSDAATPAPTPVAALLDSLEQEGRSATPAGSTAEQAAQKAGEKPEAAALTVRFPGTTNELTEPAAGQVRSLGNALRQLSQNDPSLKVHLAAYAGKGESRELAELRLTRVRAMLLGRGIPADRIVAETVRSGGAGRVVITSKSG